MAALCVRLCFWQFAGLHKLYKPATAIWEVIQLKVACSRSVVQVTYLEQQSLPSRAKV